MRKEFNELVSLLKELYTSHLQQERRLVDITNTYQGRDDSDVKIIDSLKASIRVNHENLQKITKMLAEINEKTK